MTDEALRTAERAAAAGGEEEAVRAFVARLRTGKVTVERAQIAAVLGWGPARGALGLGLIHDNGRCSQQAVYDFGGGPPVPEHVPGDFCAELTEPQLVERLVRFGPRVGVRLGLEVAHLVALRQHSVLADDPFETCLRRRCQPNRLALVAARAWCDEDDDNNHERARLVERFCLEAGGPGARWITSLGHAVAAWAGDAVPEWLHSAAEHFLIEAVVDGLDLLAGPSNRAVELHRATDALLAWVLA